MQKCSSARSGGRLGTPKDEHPLEPTDIVIRRDTAFGSRANCSWSMSITARKCSLGTSASGIQMYVIEL